jgi:hypothetical protein
VYLPLHSPGLSAPYPVCICFLPASLLPSVPSSPLTRPLCSQTRLCFLYLPLCSQMYVPLYFLGLSAFYLSLCSIPDLAPYMPLCFLTASLLPNSLLLNCLPLLLSVPSSPLTRPLCSLPCLHLLPTCLSAPLCTFHSTQASLLPACLSAPSLSHCFLPASLLPICLSAPYMHLCSLLYLQPSSILLTILSAPYMPFSFLLLASLQNTCLIAPYFPIWYMPSSILPTSLSTP